MATLHFAELIVQMTDAATDHEHIPMVIWNQVNIADRTSYMLGKSQESPLPAIVETLHSLEQAGAEVVAVPCVTAHSFYHDVATEAKVSVLDIVQETARALKEKGIKHAGIMATEGTIACGFLQKALEEQGITPYVPDESGKKCLMEIIYQQIKANRPIDMDSFYAVAEGLKAQGAEVILLGCTELPLIRREYELEPYFFDMLELLAAVSIEACGGKLNKKI